MLDVHGGGKRSSTGESDFLIWETPHELKLQDRISFSFEQGSVSSPKGQLFASEPVADGEKTDFSSPPADEELQKLEARPTQNEGLSWLFSRDGSAPIRVSPDAARQHVSFGLLWNEDRPDRLRANLSKSSLDEIVGRTGGEEVFLEYVPLGTRFEITVGI